MASAEEWMNMFHGAQDRIRELDNKCAKLQEKINFAKEMQAAAKMSPALIEKILGDK